MSEEIKKLLQCTVRQGEGTAAGSKPISTTLCESSSHLWKLSHAYGQGTFSFYFQSDTEETPDVNAVWMVSLRAWRL